MRTRWILAALVLSACGGGAAGKNGIDGKDGVDGVDGKDGQDAVSFLNAVTPESAGANCANGGVRVDVGPDTNANGALDPSEITSTTYVCNGATGTSYLTNITAEPVGTNCAAGGVRIEAGPDTNDDGALDAGEVKSTNFVCNGANGADGADGADGVAYLSTVTPEAAGTNCATGGLKLETGPDTNGNGSLEAGELVNTNYVCNGADGADGADGTNGTSYLSSVTPEPSGANCTAGGLRVQNGPDTNGNGTLDAAEVKSTAYVCNGLQTLASVVAEPAGANCAAGGARVQTGTDTNGNGTLDAAEVKSTAYVCNGDPVAANGTTPMVSAYADDFTNVSTTSGTVTARSVSITVPRKGVVAVVGTAEIFCANPAIGAGHDCGNLSNNDGYLSITNSAAGAATSGSYSYFYVTPQASENLNRTAIFNVPAAGTYTFYMRATKANFSGSYGVFRAELTALFIPN